MIELATDQVVVPTREQTIEMAEIARTMIKDFLAVRCQNNEMITKEEIEALGQRIIAEQEKR